MIFQHTIDKVLSGEKTQTRRIVKPGEMLIKHPYSDAYTCVEFRSGGVDYETYNLITVGAHPDFYSGRELTPEEEGERRVVWQVGKDYAVQPGRGKKAVARIRILSIRREDVRTISDEDVKAEGFGNRVMFMNVWLQMHDSEIYEIFRDYRFPYQEYKQAAPFIRSRPAERYDAWALTFEVVK